ncbi:MAG: hypothetical protein M5R36_17000 [Deltaproteobacteria bacterium]|nr:hypothetical protein [Deltaproteobacteria bacterium]
MKIWEETHTLVIGSRVEGGQAIDASPYAAAVAAYTIRGPAPDVTIINSVLNGGEAAQSNGIILAYAALLQLVNSDVWADSIDCFYYWGWSVCWPNPSTLNQTSIFVTEAVGNFSLDPQFTDDLGHLAETSPCVDAGTDPDVYLGEFSDWSNWLGVDVAELIAHDRDGDPRPHGPAWDIGPDEWTPQ